IPYPLGSCSPGVPRKLRNLLSENSLLTSCRVRRIALVRFHLHFGRSRVQPAVLQSSRHPTSRHERAPPTAPWVRSPAHLPAFICAGASAGASPHSQSLWPRMLWPFPLQLPLSPCLANGRKKVFPFLSVCTGRRCKLGLMVAPSLGYHVCK